MIRRMQLNGRNLGSPWLMLFGVVGLVSLLSACSPAFNDNESASREYHSSAWNSPHPAREVGENILYSSFSGQPKHLDPAISYSADESRFIDQIYDPPLQYHYLKRPFELEPNTLVRMPTIRYLDANGNDVDENSSAVAFSEYDFELKPGILYQPHPAFALTNEGEPYYQFAKPEEAQSYSKLRDFRRTDTRELKATDYVYQIRRLADPSLLSPIRGLLEEYIDGMTEFGDAVKAARESLPAGAWLNLNEFEFSGVEVLSDYEYTVRLKGKYPQFSYWLAFHFFAPLPIEADRFYHMPGMEDRNIVLDWYPIGTGAYMMTQNDPNEAIILERNPNYRDDFYPTEGEEGDAEAGLLEDAGKKIPFIDKVVYRLEKEAIPLWTKFLQGYYDRSGVSSDSFDQAIRVGAGGIGLTDEMRDRGITLERVVVPGTFYFAFNMLDEVVGDTGTKKEREQKQKLRHAIAIAYDQGEYISIFQNGRGEVGMSPVPPGIFGYQQGKEGINPYVFDWVDGRPKRRSIADAKKLLDEAGYPEGRNAKTGKPLVLNLDSAGGSGGSAAQSWLIKQFAKLNIQLNIRGTDYNRFKEKMNTGNAQMFQWGWLADYPDAENFLFLLYGPNGQVVTQGAGVNSSNYNNSEYNRLFEKMKLMENSPERMKIIRRMLEIFHRDMPWGSIFHPHDYVLNNPWVYNSKPHGISKAILKYLRIDPEVRQTIRGERNNPVFWPLLLVALALLLLAWPGYRAYRQRQQGTLASAINSIEDAKASSPQQDSATSSSVASTSASRKRND
ncbi:MAG: ABC transporter substrate-binding protein [Oleibacter sp.]|nr:ABC transporter substrate-binding protein [Thalassolituus sp.]